ncbi:radial spoke head protein 3 homolog isoform X1 [Drosophila pseudoobscura]|uniref:Radial spoke head protein 3 homolog isoform X1 n=1 Tax=Drosophila pseudoobscura pseudoobscura TaxID=46245 RepID=B5DRH1_DROPS|nr:radial spoke head protein 3 homolog isoform X1 [Drosophila pseudoobscura]
MPETETTSSSSPKNQHEDHFPKPQPQPQQQQQQNFSFSSSYPYAPGRTSNSNSNSNSNLNNSYNVQRYQSPYNFQHVVTNAFSVLQPHPSEDLALNPRPQQAIVRPTRRQEVPLEPEPSVDHVDPPRSFFSRSNQEVRSFADELSHKLRFLAPEENYGGGISSIGGITGAWMAARHSGDMTQRPRFETTVPTGIFLPPPHEVQMLPASMLRRHVYAYSSYPMILQSYYSKDPLKSPNPGEKEPKAVTATRLNGFRATAAVAAATAAVAVAAAPVAAAPKAPSTDQTQSLAGGLHITKAQFQQQLQQRRGTSDKRAVVPPPEPYKNVMYDRRVIKGSNFGNASMVADVDPFDKAAEIKRRNMLRKRSIQCRNQRNVLGTPPPVKGRKHETIQTEKYLEKLGQRPPEFTVDTQTDLFLEKPPTPPFIAAKVGVDVGTEIGEGELFHFDAEAQPIIDVLVDACIEQSMLEVAHEMELDSLRRKQEEFLAQREVELAELRRLEAEEMRLRAEKERRLRQDAIAKELDAEMQKSVTAAKLLQGHIASLVPEVLENIEPASDAVKKEQLMKSICPWLSAEVAEEVGHIVDSREILTAIIQEIIKQRAEVYAGYREDLSEATTLTTDVCEEEGCMVDEMEACPCETGTEEECPTPPPEPPHL